MTDPRSYPDSADEVVWTHGYNSCLHVAISALNYLSSHSRPVGGQEAYNAEHLLQIADEIKRTIAHNVKVTGLLDLAQGAGDCGAKAYVERAIASYVGDPADNQFQKGFLAALEVVRDEAFLPPSSQGNTP